MTWPIPIERDMNMLYYCFFQQHMCVRFQNLWGSCTIGKNFAPNFQFDIYYFGILLHIFCFKLVQCAYNCSRIDFSSFSIRIKIFFSTFDTSSSSTWKAQVTYPHSKILFNRKLFQVGEFGLSVIDLHTTSHKNSLIVKKYWYLLVSLHTFPKLHCNLWSN